MGGCYKKGPYPLSLSPSLLPFPFQPKDQPEVSVTIVKGGRKTQLLGFLPLLVPSSQTHTKDATRESVVFILKLSWQPDI